MAPDCTDSIVDLPITFFGGTSSTRRRAAARSNRASIEISMPGKIAPPRYSPFSLIASIVFAVPKSTTIDGPPYRSYAATALAMRSGPTSFGLSYRIGMPLRTPGSTTRASNPK